MSTHTYTFTDKLLLGTLNIRFHKEIRKKYQYFSDEKNALVGAMYMM